MDEPLFGEQKKQTQVSQIIVGVLVTLFSLFSVAAGCYFGIKQNKRDFVLVVTLIVIFASLALLVRWWRDKEDRIHPKFKYLIGVLVLATIMAAVSINCFIWEKPPKGPECNGFYNLTGGVCYKYPQGFPCQCIYFDFTANTTSCMDCPGTSSSQAQTSSEASQGSNATTSGQLYSIPII
ncbi:hypothetical protein DLAC_05036 [Tieghemostelium lacteum]|uniref:Transmembrane protein n=1 Tax=Tieghemostelium lacteum TaxID=361077 RepID=A0A151ZI62_TIELA|nr:hypothetical protein DLAC_05036 [Tieghemostelium lacteum]|eukprot:KYQ93653.1 hypothetical protein DLAC_05036 [Tieghemostelium lacteum]